MPVERSKDHIARVGELSDPLEGSSTKGHQNGFRGCEACVFLIDFTASVGAKLRQHTPTYRRSTAAAVLQPNGRTKGLQATCSLKAVLSQPGQASNRSLA